MRTRFPHLVPPVSLALLAVSCGSKGEKGDKGERLVRVAAAADLKGAFEELGPAFEKKSGHKVSFTFGSTGQLSKQLKEGAPFDVFAAANVSYVDDVVTAGACDGATKAPYARGRLAIWLPSASKAAAPKTLAELVDARFTHIAIANPEHAPYGAAAKQAMEKAGVWEKVKDRIVKGENVQATLEIAESGNAEVAVIAYSLVVHREGGTTALVDPAQHDPIDQALVVCGHGADAEGGRLFAAYVGSPEGREIMRGYGFTLPGEVGPTAGATSASANPP